MLGRGPGSLTRAHLLGLLVAATVSAWGSSLAWQGMPDRSPPPLPPAHPRAPTPAELASLQSTWAEFAAALQVAARRKGTPLRVHELEALAPDGQPWLPRGIPDNPLVPGVGWVLEACPPRPPATARPDWVWCPETGELWATGTPQPRDSSAPTEPVGQGSG